MDIDQAQEVQTVSAVMAVRDTIGLDGGKEEKIEEDLDWCITINGCDKETQHSVQKHVSLIMSVWHFKYIKKSFMLQNFS